jgi:hypothetical protein
MRRRRKIEQSNKNDDEDERMIMEEMKVWKWSFKKATRSSGKN